ncbi:MAG: thioredoxin domain-containing protein [Pyrinomonadaceae bacterium]
MKILVAIFCLIIFVFNCFAQTDAVLATANNQNFTARDLPPQVAENYSKLPQIIKDSRTELLAQQIADALLDAEAKARKTTIENLVATEVRAKIPAPTEAQIQAVYDANKAQIGDQPIAEVRPQIVEFLRREPEQKGLIEYIARLKPIHKAAMVKDVNAPLLQPSDALATIDGKPITDKEFEEKAGQNLYDARMTIYEQTADALRQLVFSTLLSAEAKQLGIQPEDVIAREVTDKMKEFSDDEREKLQANLEQRLYQKYAAKILLKEPAPFRQNIVVLPDNPSRGSVNAPVTVVMFTDFQCPACAAAHPILQKVLAEYGGEKVRFVVRDFPLTLLHNNAYNAALAAAAARAQGKFFEYTDILYKNQDKLAAASLKKYASDLGLNRRQFDADLDGKKFEPDVKKDIEDGAAYGVNATPTIYVNGVKARLLSAAGFRKAIEQGLKK